MTSRLSFGITPQTDGAVQALGVEGWLEDQLSKNSPDPAVEAQMNNYVSLGRTPAQARPLHNDDRNHVRELYYGLMTRAVNSEHQLFETVAHMWMDHFNISFVDRREYKQMWFQERAIRPNSMTRFVDLLVATANNGSMMEYLNNDISDARSSINENYGRELLELHSLGTNPDGTHVYTEADVIGASHVMSGWSREFNDSSGNFGQFVYRSEQHSTESVSLLGGQWTNSGLSGKAAGDSLLQFLARHPATARNVARRICTRYVSDAPSNGLIESAAQVYLANDTAIVPVLRHVFSSAEFAGSDGQKMRRPFEMVAATMRALGTQLPDDPRGDAGDFVEDRLRELSHLPWQWPTPDGFPDDAGSWLNSTKMINTWAVVNRIANQRNSVVTSPDSIRGTAATAGELFDQLSSRLNLGVLDAGLRAQLLDLSGVSEDTPVADMSDNRVIGLAQFLLAHPLFFLR